MSVFGSDSSSSSSDNRQTATGQGRNVRGNNRITEAGGVSIGDRASVNTGTQVQATGNVTINDTGPLTDALNQSNQSLQSALGLTGDTFKSALGQLSTLAVSAQTGGQSGLSKTFLWMVAGLFATLVAVFYLMKK